MRSKETLQPLSRCSNARSRSTKKVLARKTRAWLRPWKIRRRCSGRWGAMRKQKQWHLAPGPFEPNTDSSPDHKRQLHTALKRIAMLPGDLNLAFCRAQCIDQIHAEIHLMIVLIGERVFSRSA